MQKGLKQLMASFMSSLLLANQLLVPCSAVFAETLHEDFEPIMAVTADDPSGNKPDDPVDTADESPKNDKQDEKSSDNKEKSAKGTVHLKAKVVLSDGSEPEKDQFTFQLMSEDKVLQEAKNDNDGVVDFVLNFTEKDAEKSFTYQIKEVKGDNQDLDYDNNAIDYSSKKS